jgi:transcriptional antiterminator RfaH
MEHWYTLHAKTNAEYYVATALAQRGLEAYLPEIEMTKPSGEIQSVPFFPSYLFVKVDFQEVALSQIEWTPGLNRIVGFGDQPVPVAEEVIALIGHNLARQGPNLDQAGLDLEPGDPVRITNGPFQDLIGIFAGSVSPKERVEVLLSVLGTSRVQVAVTDLEKVAKPQSTARPGPAPAKRARRTRGRGRRIKQVSQLGGATA